MDKNWIRALLLVANPNYIDNPSPDKAPFI